MGNRSHHLGTHIRMHLDTGLVRNTIREVTQIDACGNCYVGFCLIHSNQQPIIDNNTVTNMMLDRAMQTIVYDWYRRFGVPLPYHSVVDATLVRNVIRTVGGQVKHP